MKYNRQGKIKHIISILLIILCLMLSLCACGGKGEVKYDNADGSMSRICYENHFVLTRAPRFTADDRSITMQFNGREWYTAVMIGEQEYQRIAEWELLAQSSNIQVFRNKSDSEYKYIYVLKLEGSKQAYIAISSTDAPDQRGYGTDFDYCIRYFVDTLETIPDMNWKSVH